MDENYGIQRDWKIWINNHLISLKIYSNQFILISRYIYINQYPNPNHSYNQGFFPSFSSSWIYTSKFRFESDRGKRDARSSLLDPRLSPPPFRFNEIPVPLPLPLDDVDTELSDADAAWFFAIVYKMPEVW